MTNRPFSPHTLKYAMEISNALERFIGPLTPVHCYQHVQLFDKAAAVLILSAQKAHYAFASPPSDADIAQGLSHTGQILRLSVGIDAVDHLLKLNKQGFVSFSLWLDNGKVQFAATQDAGDDGCDSGTSTLITFCAEPFLSAQDKDILFALPKEPKRFAPRGIPIIPIQLTQEVAT